MKKTSQGTLPYQLICKTNNKVSCEETYASFQLALDRLTKEKKNMIKPCSFEAKIYYFYNNKKQKLLSHNKTFYKD